MSGARHRWKGNRVEREIVSRHKALGIHLERYAVSGAGRFRGGRHYVDIYSFGDKAPAVAKLKGRKAGPGFAILGRLLSKHAALFLRRNNGDALVPLPWRVFQRVRGLRSMTNLLARLNGVSGSGDGWTARCPAHEDRDRRMPRPVSISSSSRARRAGAAPLSEARRKISMAPDREDNAADPRRLGKLQRPKEIGC
jgi:hypothetical protein